MTSGDAVYAHLLKEEADHFLRCFRNIAVSPETPSDHITKLHSLNSFINLYDRNVAEKFAGFFQYNLQVGMYTDVLFPEFGVHFVAVNDGVDSTWGENEFTAIRNVFNEMYACDTSKKIRATWQSKGKSGEHLTTIPPYGYIKDPEDKKKWIVDEEAAAVVQKIFSLCVDGLGLTQIAKWLKQHQILNPAAYAHYKGLPASNKPTADPYKWTNETVSRILECVDYLGHTLNFRTTKQSYTNLSDDYLDDRYGYNVSVRPKTPNGLVKSSDFHVIRFEGAYPDFHSIEASYWEVQQLLKNIRCDMEKNRKKLMSKIA